jgi:hypothetical protein
VWPRLLLMLLLLRVMAPCSPSRDHVHLERIEPSTHSLPRRPCRPRRAPVLGQRVGAQELIRRTPRAEGLAPTAELACGLGRELLGALLRLALPPELEERGIGRVVRARRLAIPERALARRERTGVLVAGEAVGVEEAGAAPARAELQVRRLRGAVVRLH